MRIAQRLGIEYRNDLAVPGRGRLIELDFDTPSRLRLATPAQRHLHANTDGR
jgi:hypothetical protein